MKPLWGSIAIALLGLLFIDTSVAQQRDNRTREAPRITLSSSDKAIQDYKLKLQAYLEAHGQYERDADVYWTLVAGKRRTRVAKRNANQEILLDDYVLTQPPKYSGPPKPVDPSGAPEEPPVPKYVPVKDDFLKNAVEYFQFAPQQPDTESQYKRAYVKVAFEAGLTKEQVVRIYAFEAGGNGTYDVQAGLETSKPGARAISTALGYNQLLSTNSVELLAEHGSKFITQLKKIATAIDHRSKERFEPKIRVIQRIVEFCQTFPDEWSEHEKLANTPQGIGIHATLLDVDIGPLLQAQKLLDSVVFARRKGLQRTVIAAELEMMNLTGDGNGFDMITIPEHMRDKVPTSNFFQPIGYERNPVAIRHNVVAKLLAATDAIMDRESALQGAREMGEIFLKATKRQPNTGR
jgi:hypothetical protein